MLVENLFMLREKMGVKMCVELNWFIICVSDFFLKQIIVFEYWKDISSVFFVSFPEKMLTYHLHIYVGPTIGQFTTWQLTSVRMSMWKSYFET